MAIYVNGKKVAGLGMQGPPGANGTDGKSAFQIASENGYTGTEQEFNQTLGNLDELFTSVSDGKSAIAAAITDKGVTTAADATFQQMADNISMIPSSGEKSGVYTITGTINEAGEALIWDKGNLSEIAGGTIDDFAIAALIMIPGSGGANDKIMCISFGDSGSGQSFNSSGGVAFYNSSDIIRYTGDIDANLYWMIDSYSFMISYGSSYTAYVLLK